MSFRSNFDCSREPSRLLAGVCMASGAVEPELSEILLSVDKQQWIINQEVNFAWRLARKQWIVVQREGNTWKTHQRPAFESLSSVKITISNAGARRGAQGKSGQIHLGEFLLFVPAASQRWVMLLLISFPARPLLLTSTIPGTAPSFSRVFEYMLSLYWRW